MVDHTSEALVAEIQEAHDRLGLYHFSFAAELGEIIEKAQEVYVREEIVKGLTEVAMPGWYYFDKYNDREGDRAELDDEIEFWFGEDGQLRDALEDYYKEGKEDKEDEEEEFYKLIDDEI